MNRRQLTHTVQTQAEVIWAFSCAMYPRLARFNLPKISLCGRLWRTAGMCYQEENTISLGYKFFLHSEAYHREMMRVILPHEIAHQIDYNLFGESEEKTGHGRNWQAIMVDYGLQPDVYHRMGIKR